MEARHTFDLNQFKKLRRIGKGGFGKVYKAKEIATGKIYAAKVFLIDLEKIDEEEEEEEKREIFKNSISEIKVISNLYHPSITRFIGFSLRDFDNQFKPTIITEFIECVNLRTLIDKERKSMSDPRWNDTQKLITIYGIASAMRYLHANQVIHRDLKPSNVLMDSNLFPKITDYGLSKTLHQDQEAKGLQANKTSTSLKTLAYTAPETIKDEEITKAGDVYSFSMIVYEIMTSKKPFENCSFSEIIKNVTNGVRPEFTVTISEPYRKLIEDCWSPEASKRPTFEEIVQDVKSNDGYITEMVEKDEFMYYVDYIENFESTLNSEKNSEDIEKVYKKWESYYNGQDGCQVDKKKAAWYCRIAANKGHIEAMKNYSEMLLKGDGVPLNKEEAERYSSMVFESNKRTFKFKLNKSEEITLKLPLNLTILQTKEMLADCLNKVNEGQIKDDDDVIEPDSIDIIFAGKTLRKNMMLEALNLDEDEALNVLISKSEEILLRTAKALRFNKDLIGQNMESEYGSEYEEEEEDN